MNSGFKFSDGGVVPIEEKFHLPRKGEIIISQNELNFSASPSKKEKVYKLLKEHPEGMECECCGRYMKLYHRTLHFNAVKQLINLYNLGGDKEFIHGNIFTESKTSGKDFTLAKHWKLIEKSENSDQKKKTSGAWRLTQKGVDFLCFRTSIPKYVYIYNDQPLGFSEEKINVKECFKEKFDYENLMKQTFINQEYFRS